MECEPMHKLIVREWMTDAVRSKALDITDCILDRGCKFWQEDEDSAEEIADCLIEHVDIQEWTDDEFEYAIRLVNYFCALKFAYINGILKEDADGHLKVPDKWKNDLSMNGFEEGDIDEIRDSNKG